MTGHGVMPVTSRRSPTSSWPNAGLAYPNAGSLVQLAHARAMREDFVPHWELEPIYLRQPDAEINWQTREGVHREAS